MPPDDTSHYEITYIREMLSELTDMATARGDRILARQIAMAWELECKLAMRQWRQQAHSLLNWLLVMSPVAF